ncbi:MAG: preprotein translocase subunit SecG [bacterium]|nr:preprotein translocase subunit SecG [bacterium]
MKIFLLIVEAFTAVALIIAVLLHSAKGEGLSGIGGQANIFNSQKGLEAGLNKATWTLAAIFMICAILLSILF